MNVCTRVCMYVCMYACMGLRDLTGLYRLPPSSPTSSLLQVCTDRTSRGVDFDTADVEHVVLFDFPRDPSEYVRRVGRTGRAGRVGRVTALVLGKQVGECR